MKSLLYAIAERTVGSLILSFIVAILSGSSETLFGVWVFSGTMSLSFYEPLSASHAPLAGHVTNLCRSHHDRT